MFAFISNEYKAVVNTQRQLDFLIGIYSFPNFCRVDSIEEAKVFWAQNERKNFNSEIARYDSREKVAYVTVEYFIADNNIYINLSTKNFGFIRFKNLPDNIKVEHSYDLIKFKICNVILDNSLIAHHCISISNILKILGPYVNIEFILPDISVYLALTRYTGTNYIIKKAKNELASRCGSVYYSVKR